jgi:hypothetical protein
MCSWVHAQRMHCLALSALLGRCHINSTRRNNCCICSHHSRRRELGLVSPIPAAARNLGLHNILHALVFQLVRIPS